MTGWRSRQGRRWFSGIAQAGGKSSIPPCCRRAASRCSSKTSKLLRAPAPWLSTESDSAVNLRRVYRSSQRLRTESCRSPQATRKDDAVSRCFYTTPLGAFFTSGGGGAFCTASRRGMWLSNARDRHVTSRLGLGAGSKLGAGQAYWAAKGYCSWNEYMLSLGREKLGTETSDVQARSYHFRLRRGAG